MLAVERIAPGLRIFSVEKSAEKAMEFYVGYLGFTVDWEHRFEQGLPLYAQVSRGGLTLHLTEHHGDACPGSTVWVHLAGLDELHRELAAKEYGYLRPEVEDVPWQARMMEVTDPFGNRIRFQEDLPERSTQ